MAQLEALDNGKSVVVAGVADVPLAVDLFRYMAGMATKLEGQTIPGSFLVNNTLHQVLSFIHIHQENLLGLLDK